MARKLIKEAIPVFTSIASFLKFSYFIHCKKCDYFLKFIVFFVIARIYYIYIIMMEVRVCTELLLKNY